MFDYINKSIAETKEPQNNFLKSTPVFQGLENILNTCLDDSVFLNIIPKENFDKLHGNIIKPLGNNKYTLLFPKDFTISDMRLIIDNIQKGGFGDNLPEYIYAPLDEFKNKFLNNSDEIIHKTKGKTFQILSLERKNNTSNIQENTHIKEVFVEAIEMFFFKKALYRLGTEMKTITQDEQKKILSDNQKKTNKKHHENISPSVKTDKLDIKKRLLRDKIGIDTLKKELQETRNKGNEKEIRNKEIQATNKILHTIYEYPYQLTKNNYGYNIPKILQEKEIHCVGFSLLGHTFLEELGIEHTIISFSNHAALEIIIGGVSYYFDATSNNKIYEITVLEQKGNTKAFKNKNPNDKCLYFGSFTSNEKTLLSIIYDLKGSDILNGLVEYKSKNEAIKVLYLMYKRAIAINNKNFSAYHNMGFCLFANQNKPEEALLLLEKSMQINPYCIHTIETLLYILNKTKDSTKILYFYQKIKNLHPNYTYLLHFGHSLKRLGKNKEASFVYFDILKTAIKNKTLNLIKL